MLKAIVTNFNGGPVGLNNLAAMVGEESETVETVCEPYLVREGFLIRTPKGRVATRKAWSILVLLPTNPHMMSIRCHRLHILSNVFRLRP